jgi:serine/threonine protein phosphatase PrpC
MADRLYPGLAMSRSIGDFDAKDCGVTAEPVATKLDIDVYGVTYVILASDGIWDVMGN